MQCGDGLQQLCQSPEVVEFLKECHLLVIKPSIVMGHFIRSVYVSQLSWDLCCFKYMDLGRCLIDEHVDYRLLLPPTINLQTHVIWGKATVTAECDTVNVGDFVLYNDRAGSPVSPPDSVFFSTCAVL